MKEKYVINEECFTCPLPDCDDESPKCPIRIIVRDSKYIRARDKSPEARKQYNKQQRDRRRKQKLNE